MEWERSFLVLLCWRWETSLHKQRSGFTKTTVDGFHHNNGGWTVLHQWWIDLLHQQSTFYVDGGLTSSHQWWIVITTTVDGLHYNNGGWASLHQWWIDLIMSTINFRTLTVDWPRNINCGDLGHYKHRWWLTLLHEWWILASLLHGGLTSLQNNGGLISPRWCSLGGECLQ